MSIKRRGQRRARTRFRAVRRATDDTPGRVIVMIRRWEKGRIKPGNISRTIKLEDARVSEVGDAIEVALFGRRATG